MKNLNSIQKLILFAVGVILIYNLFYTLPRHYELYNYENEHVTHSIILLFWSKISMVLIIGFIFIFILNNKTVSLFQKINLSKPINKAKNKLLPVIIKNKNRLLSLIILLAITSLCTYIYSIYLNKKYNSYTNTINSCNKNIYKYNHKILDLETNDFKQHRQIDNYFENLAIDNITKKTPNKKHVFYKLDNNNNKIKITTNTHKEYIIKVLKLDYWNTSGIYRYSSVDSLQKLIKKSIIDEIKKNILNKTGISECAYNHLMWIEYYNLDKISLQKFISILPTELKYNTKNIILIHNKLNVTKHKYSKLLEDSKNKRSTLIILDFTNIYITLTIIGLILCILIILHDLNKNKKTNEN